MRAVALAGTILLHSLLLATALSSCQGSPVPAPAAVQEPSGEPLEVRLLSTSEAGTWTCESTYDGIGLMNMGGVAFDVAENGPAWKAGIRDGDRLDGLDDLWPGKHKPGTWVTIRKLVNQQWVPLRLMIETICRT
jgi:hypothetical protein